MTTANPDAAWLERCKLALSGRCPRGTRSFAKHLYRKNGECRRCGFTRITIPESEWVRLGLDRISQVPRKDEA